MILNALRQRLILYTLHTEIERRLEMVLINKIHNYMKIMNKKDCQPSSRTYIIKCQSRQD